MIGEQLRTLRTANKMTQKELAGELSVAFQTISNWENNSIDPSVSMILRIAEYFNCSTDYLLIFSKGMIQVPSILIQPS